MFPGGRAEKAPTLNSVYTTQAVWELESGEGEPDDEHGLDRENWHDQLQIVVNDVWHRKWKAKVAKMTCEQF